MAPEEFGREQWRGAGNVQIGQPTGIPIQGMVVVTDQAVYVAALDDDRQTVVAIHRIPKDNLRAFTPPDGSPRIDLFWIPDDNMAAVDAAQRNYVALRHNMNGDLSRFVTMNAEEHVTLLRTLRGYGTVMAGS